MTELYERLREACAGASDDAMICFRSRLAPDQQGAKVAPPTYPDGSVIYVDTADGKKEVRTRYLLEDRLLDGAPRGTVLLDSVQSQANRAEEALQRLISAGRLPYPQFEVVAAVDADRTVRIPSLRLPHRYADAYLRDSSLDGTPLDKTPVGKALQLSTPEDATALYERSPESLIFGAWNSQRKGRQAKFPRVYRSEVIGLDPVVGIRRAGRMDPENLSGAAKPLPDGEWEYAVPDGAKVKGEKLSERGLGNVAPGEAPGGVTISSAVRSATLSFAGLRRLGFGTAGQEAAASARVALAALALLADRAAFTEPSLWLRSGCDLVLAQDHVAFLRRGGEEDVVDVDTEAALNLFTEARDAAERNGIAMATDRVELRPNEKSLGEAIRYAYLRASAEETE